MTNRTGEDGNYERGDSGLYDLRRDILETLLIGLVVAFINGKVEPVGTVDLDVYQARAVNGRSAFPAVASWLGEGNEPEDIAPKIYNISWSLSPLVKRPLRETTGSARKQIHLVESVGETNLGIEDYASLLVYPKILLHQLSVLLREETIRKAKETVRRRHSCAKEGGRTFEFFLVS